MDKYAKAFVKASLVYLGIGVIIGIEMLIWPDVRFTYLRIHVHLLLLGFMAMMIYGVGYHILPRFMGRPVYSGHLGNIQAWLANVTLIGLCISWILEVSQGRVWHYFVILFGVGQGVSIFLFMINLWMSMIPQTDKSKS